MNAVLTALIYFLLVDLIIVIFAINIGDIKAASYSIVTALFTAMAIFEIKENGGAI